jgi:hypothetical protein
MAAFAVVMTLAIGIADCEEMLEENPEVATQLKTACGASPDVPTVFRYRRFS